MRRLTPAVLLALATLTSTGSLTLAGPLNPPAGPVTPTYKTLLEVEPRTAINATNTPGDSTSVYIISQPGSYYLTGNLTGQSGKRGIRVTASNVTIDLNGYTMQGATNSGAGITDTEDELQRIQNLVVRNGVIRGFASQIVCAWCDSGAFEDLTLVGNYSGIIFNGPATLNRCTAIGTGIGSIGVELDGTSTVTDCRVSGHATGFLMSGGTIQGSSATLCQIGFSLSDTLATGCSVQGASLHGFEINSRSTLLDSNSTNCATGVNIIGFSARVEGCTINQPAAYGIRVQHHNAQILRNSIIGNQQAGQWGIQVNAGVNGAHIEGNVGHANSAGLSVQGTNCTIIRNTFGGCFASVYVIGAGNRFGSLVKLNSSVGTQSVSASSSTVNGTVTTTTDPHANLFY